MSRLGNIRAQVDPILTQFAVGFNPPANRIGRKVATVLPVRTRTGKFYTFGSEGFKIYNSERALRADAKKIDFAFGSDSYETAEHTLGTMLDYKEIDEAKRSGGNAVLQIERQAIFDIQNPLEIEMEKNIADTVFAAANYATANKTALSGTARWQVSGGGEGSASTPIININTGIDAARASMGLKPNTLVLGYKAFRALKEHSTVKELFKYSQAAVITEQMIANVFGLDNVWVGESNYKDDSGNWVDLWTDNAAILYVPPQTELMRGTTPHTVVMDLVGGVKAKTYDSANNKHYQVTREYVVKLISNTYGYLISDVVE